MKRNIVIILALAFVNISILFSQTTEKELSNAEKISSKVGSLIESEWIEIGQIGETKIKVMHITDLMTKSKTSALRFEKVVSGSYTSDTKLGVLDEDEVDGLIKALEILKTIIATDKL